MKNLPNELEAAARLRGLPELDVLQGTKAEAEAVLLRKAAKEIIQLRQLRDDLHKANNRLVNENRRLKKAVRTVHATAEDMLSSTSEQRGD